MITRLSNLFFKTLREDPADAEIPSHRLLVRAGYIRRAGPGAFTWLPLGLMVLRNVERIIREEMDGAGFQEVQFPALLPREPYEATGRWADYGDNLFRLQDRRGNDFLLAPTHEEMFTLIVKDLCSSYKDLPLRLYQIQEKFRDEARPRAGLLRGREFAMKDSYSFDLDAAGLAESYRLHRDAYIATFDRLQLPYVIVSAVSGAMGGSASEEFLATLPVGEDTFVQCRACGYAANVEAFETVAPPERSFADEPAARVADTPDTPTIESLVALFNERADLRRADGGEWTAANTLKNVVVNLHFPDGRVEPLAIGLPGDREVDLKRVAAGFGEIDVELFSDEDFAAHPLLVKGYIGPEVLGADGPAGVRYLVDPRVVPGTTWITGANEAGRHVHSLTAGRDFTPDGTIEAAEVSDDDVCPECGGAVELARGVEIGHIFQLGTKYADALGLQVLDENGKQVTVTMGSYGIGVSRAVAAIAEAHHDEAGLCWPVEVAPADVHLVVAGKDDLHVQAAAEAATALDAAGVRVLLDDRRDVSPGVKFKDADLLGVPTIVVFGRDLAGGLVEVKDRRTGDRTSIPLADLTSSFLRG